MKELLNTGIDFLGNYLGEISAVAITALIAAIKRKLDLRKIKRERKKIKNYPTSMYSKD